MQISNILSSLADPAGWGKKNNVSTLSGAAAANSIDDKAQTNPAAAKAAVEILRNYNVKNITPEEFSQMIQKLQQAGVLSEKDVQDLAAVRVDLQNARIEPDESVDLLEFYTRKIDKAQQNLEDGTDNANAVQSMAPYLQRLEWLQKFATIHDNPEAGGLDLAA
ncbi:MAG: hypothetical protein ACWGMZ_13465 [Thermoguttaceae bacterium]